MRSRRRSGGWTDASAPLRSGGGLRSRCPPPLCFRRWTTSGKSIRARLKADGLTVGAVHHNLPGQSSRRAPWRAARRPSSETFERLLARAGKYLRRREV